MSNDGWDVLETETKENAPLMATISYIKATRASKQLGGGRISKPDAKPRLYISIPSAVISASKAKRFVLQIGRGQHAGMARLSKCAESDKRGVKPTELAHTFRFVFGHVPLLGKSAAAPEKVKIEKEDEDHYIIHLPAWFKEEQA